MPTTQNLAKFFSTVQAEAINPSDLGKVIDTIQADIALQQTLLIMALLSKDPLKALTRAMALGFCLGQVQAETQSLEQMMKEAGA